MAKGKKYKLAPNPDDVIDECIAREDWFSAFSNAVSYFEHWGYWRLDWYCIEQKIDVKNRIKRLTPSSLTLTLYLLKLIDQDTFSKMTKTIQERNKLVHPISGGQGIRYRRRKQADRAIEVLQNAKECIRKLRKGVGKHSP